MLRSLGRHCARENVDESQQEEGSLHLWRSEDLLNTLQAVKSPQFKWNTQNTLWECLEQIGGVIDTIPQMIVNLPLPEDVGDEPMSYVSFEFINGSGNEADEIGDAWTNADGENVDESQYNTALGSVVENLKEEN